jgi:hypothetical protein
MNVVSCQSIWVNEPTVEQFAKEFSQVGSGDSSGSASSSPEKFHSEPYQTVPLLIKLSITFHNSNCLPSSIGRAFDS